MQPYERLETWQRSFTLGVGVCRITRTWPADERFGLASQARRAATSIACNIAEGMSRRGTNELRRYLDIARGSLAELICILRFARELDYGSRTALDQLLDQCAIVGKLTWGLYRRVAFRTNSANQADEADT